MCFRVWARDDHHHERAGHRHGGGHLLAGLHLHLPLRGQQEEAGRVKWNKKYLETHKKYLVGVCLLTKCYIISSERPGSVYIKRSQDNTEEGVPVLWHAAWQRDSVTRRCSIFIVYGGKFSLKYYLSCTNCSLLAKVNNCDKIVTSGRHLTKSPKIETNPLVAPRPAPPRQAGRVEQSWKRRSAEISLKALLRHYAKC